MLQRLNRQTARLETRFPERIVQFGGGNFLRGFVDWIVEALNIQTDFASSVVIVKPTPHGSYAALEAQDGLFHVRLTGNEAGKPVAQASLITCISRTINPYQDYGAYLTLARQPQIRFLISNTTESGIVFNSADRFEAQPWVSFPAKLAAFLYERYCHFGGDTAYGCVVLPCELIEQNGEQLRMIILKYAELWQLPAGFTAWLESCCLFCNTLVDRIVSGFPPGDPALIFDTLGFEDQLLVEGEAYHSWVIEAPGWLEREFPVYRTNLNVKIVDDVRPYHMLKVRVLNGAHTAMVAPGLFLGLETVYQAVEHPVLGQFIRKLVFEEIVPTLDQPEANQFAEAVLARFRNPFIQHRLTSIAVNSLSKFKVRLLPTLLANYEKGTIPEHIVIAFAALIRFYRGEWRGQPLNDDPVHIEWFRQLWDSGVSSREIAMQVLSNQTLWGTDLQKMPHLVDHIGTVLDRMETQTIDNLLLKRNHDD
jgi:tagaturonate reductase